MFADERQQLYLLYLEFRGIYHIRIYQAHLIELLVLELVEDELRYLHSTVERRVLGGVEEFAVHGSLFRGTLTVLEVHSADLSHYEELDVVEVGERAELVLGEPQDIVVIASAETFIGCNDDISAFSLILRYTLTSVEVELTGMGSMFEDTLDSSLELVEVRLSVLE